MKKKRRRIKEEKRRIERIEGVGLKMKTLPEILGEIRRKTGEVRAASRRLISTFKRERQKVATEVREKIGRRVVEIKSASRQLIATSRRWRTGRP
jgi:glucose-6-phosphate-specific signal transduction histidine kinase